MGTQQRINTLLNTTRVTMDGVELKENDAKCEQLLGCLVQANLKWQGQIELLLRKLRTRLTGLIHLKFITSFEVRKMVSQGIFNSVLVYCIPVYGGCDVGQLRSIQVLQNKAAQIVCHAPPRASRDIMYSRLGWLTVNQLISYHTALTIFKIRLSGEPEYLASAVRNDNIYGRIIIPNCNLSLTMKSFTFRGSLLWNQLPQSLRNINNIRMFKISVRKWILEKIPRFIWMTWLYELQVEPWLSCSQPLYF